MATVNPYYLNIFSALVLFLLVNTPSVKLLYREGIIVNLISVIFLSMLVFINLTKRKPIFSFNWQITATILLSISLLFSVFISIISFQHSAYEFTYDFLGYLLIIYVIVFIPYIVTKRSFNLFCYCQLIWGLILCIMLAFGYTGSTDNLHRNNVAFPIVLSASVLISIIIYKFKRTNILRIGLSIVFFSQVYMLLTLRNRDGIIGLLLGFTISFSVANSYLPVLNYENIKYKIAQIGVMIGSITLIVNVVDFSSLLGRRWIRLLYSPLDEPRIEMYTDTLLLIIQNPLGHGIGSYRQVVGGSHPHNIFLEIGFSGGLISMILLLATFVVLFRGSFRIEKKDNFIYHSLLIMTIYYLLVVSSSHSLDDYYRFFTIVVLFKLYSEYSFHDRDYM